MKKTYNAPSVRITPLQLNRVLMNNGSLQINSTSVVTDGWAKEDSGWWDEDED